MTSMGEALNDNQLRSLYAWVDKIPLSRPKRNFSRDFSDGVLVAEVIAAYFPSLVELHNYPSANSSKQKLYNFETLNSKVLRRLGYVISKKDMEDMVNCVPGKAESFLFGLQQRMAQYEEERSSKLNCTRKSPRNSRATSLGTIPGESASNIATKSVSSEPPTFVSKAVSQSQIKPAKKAEVGLAKTVDAEILREKEQQIKDLQEQVVILELKVAKLEQLVRFKDSKIQKLQQMH